MILNRTIVKSKQPLCKTCRKPMKLWHPLAKEHEHYECVSDRISASLVDFISKKLTT